MQYSMFHVTIRFCLVLISAGTKAKSKTPVKRGRSAKGSEEVVIIFSKPEPYKKFLGSTILHE